MRFFLFEKLFRYLLKITFLLIKSHSIAFLPGKLFFVNKSTSFKTIFKILALSYTKKCFMIFISSVFSATYLFSVVILILSKFGMPGIYIFCRFFFEELALFFLIQ